MKKLNQKFEGGLHGESRAFKIEQDLLMKVKTLNLKSYVSDKELK